MKSKRSTVSIHIVTFNSESCIQNCLESIFQQSYSISQIIIVDNASSDRTKEFLKKYHGEIDILYNSSNKGFAQAHNQAIRSSHSDYFLVLNPDIRLDKNYVSYLIEAMEDHPSVGSSAGMLLSQNQLGFIDSAGLVIKRSRRAFDRGQNDPSLKWSRSTEVFGVSGAAALYSRVMVEDISIFGEFFDEDFFAYKEDVDVAWRAQLMGWGAYYESKAVATHERGWKSGKRKEQPIFVRRLSYINRYKMMLKNDIIGYVFLHCFYLLSFEVLSLGYTILREPQLILAWGDLFNKFATIIKKRKQIQEKRKVSLQRVYNWFNS
ncbi:glycosyltransferase family 2 protein [Paenibacillus sp. WQ 127069]|uniref:Glycosyltransferase family 2 protein n=2 Tax=Paenibacillus baimaensis TaxID=2982185 RepID=A0ABT2UCN8_9BACL|nr:glycosyltransferase family 2 protein [Paenibacillus sp. WQ 127069]